MLKSLHISNYALISNLDITFESGFSVITGETGAGKSIIIGALSLILGQRADLKAIKTDTDKCIIEAKFDISSYTHLADFFQLNDLDFDTTECIIRRELTGAGKSRSFINDTPVGLNIIRDLSGQLIDIHSQHENLLLTNLSYQLDIVDTIAQNAQLLSDFRQHFSIWKNQVSELKKLRLLADKNTQDVDYIQFQFQQLTDANLSENELTELEQELETLSHAEEIKIELLKSTQLLNSENSVLQLLNESLVAISKIKGFIKSGEDWHNRISSSIIELKDISSEISSFEERVEFNPGRLNYVETRVSELYTLLKKYKVLTVAELISIRNDFEVQLKQLDSFEFDIESLTKSVEIAHKELILKSNELSQSRKNAVIPIENYLIEELTKLGMPNIQFQVAISALDEMTENGQDEVQFMFSANKNRPVQPVAQIASGGEVSRLMLAIKSLTSNKANLPTIIFDEIDTGVSGEIAHRMGEIMQKMSEKMQVITITHLPQIAAVGTQHYRVFKDESGYQSETQIQLLNEEERIRELAQMLSGKNITDEAIKNARALLYNR